MAGAGFVASFPGLCELDRLRIALFFEVFILGVTLVFAFFWGGSPVDAISTSPGSSPAPSPSATPVWPVAFATAGLLDAAAAVEASLLPLPRPRAPRPRPRPRPFPLPLCGTPDVSSSSASACQDLQFPSALPSPVGVVLSVPVGHASHQFLYRKISDDCLIW